MSTMVQSMFGFRVSHEVPAFRTDFVLSILFDPTVAAQQIFALPKIAATFDCIFTADLPMTFGTGVFFPPITPIVRLVTDCTLARILAEHDTILSVADNLRPLSPPLILYI